MTSPSFGVAMVISGTPPSATFLALACSQFPGTSPLRAAVDNDHVEIVRLLLSHGAQVDERDRTGSSPLFYAASRGQTAMVAELLGGGANPNLANEVHETPLFEAVERGAGDIVRELLQRGAGIVGNKCADSMWLVTIIKLIDLA